MSVRYVCVLCGDAAVVFSKHLPPFGRLVLCTACRVLVFEELLERTESVVLSEVFALVKAERA